MLIAAYIRAREAIASLSNMSAALVGALLGGLAIFLGAHFHIGGWFLTGTQAYLPAIAWGAATACLIRYLLRRA